MCFSCEKECYGLKVCVSPKFYRLNPPKDDDSSK